MSDEPNRRHLGGNDQDYLHDVREEEKEAYDTFK